MNEEIVGSDTSLSTVAELGADYPLQGTLDVAVFIDETRTFASQLQNTRSEVFGCCAGYTPALERRARELDEIPFEFEEMLDGGCVAFDDSIARPVEIFVDEDLDSVAGVGSHVARFYYRAISSSDSEGQSDQ